MYENFKKSIYGLKQGYKSFNIRFNETIIEYGFTQDKYELYEYKKVSGYY